MPCSSKAQFFVNTKSVNPGNCTSLKVSPTHFEKPFPNPINNTFLRKNSSRWDFERMAEEHLICNRSERERGFQNNFSELQSAEIKEFCMISTLFSILYDFNIILLIIFCPLNTLSNFMDPFLLEAIFKYLRSLKLDQPLEIWRPGI